MADDAAKTAGGSLVVRNGKLRGLKVPVKVPVTVIGHGEACDVRLTGEGVGEWHCCLAVTPAGLAMRSWHPAETRVNGKDAAAAVLKHGDHLQVGPCQFRVAWNGELVQEPAPTGDDAEFHLKEREEALHEQERQLAAVLTARQKQVEHLLDDLAAGREALRQEKVAHHATAAEVKRMKVEAVRDRKLAGEDRAKGRAAYSKFLARLKKRWAAEKNALAGGRADILAERERLEADREAFAAERRSFVTDAELYKRRLTDAWERVADGHRRLLADRAAAEEAIRVQEEAVAVREVAVGSADKTATETRDKLRKESETLLAEVTGLESRAFHLNLKVQELEQARAAATAGLAVATAAGADTHHLPAVEIVAPVPLDRRRDKSLEQLLAEIHAKEHELVKEQQAVAKAKAAFDGLAKDLADQRAVLAGQFAKLAAAGELWHRAETVTVRELEDLARSVDRREKAVSAREHAGVRADEDRLNRQQELVQFRLKLEGWQTGLTAHEAGWYATKDKAEVELDHKREHVAKCEHALSTMATEWAQAWKAERDALKARYATFLDDQALLQARSADLERRATDVTQQAAKLAAAAVAVENAKADLAHAAGAAKAEKRVRVARKGWEKHFIKAGKDLDTRRAAALAATGTLEEKYREIQHALAVLGERTAAAVDHKRTTDLAKAKAARDTGDKAVILSIETARRKRAEREVEELRGEVERVAKVLLTTEVPVEEVVTLAKAA
jgi:hypothetical protein